MVAHGHTTGWSTRIGVRHATQAQGWYTQIRTWRVARANARRAALSARWNAGREAVRTLRANAAIDMVPPAHVLTAARAYGELAL
jgi:hypothetical protein